PCLVVTVFVFGQRLDLSAIERIGQRPEREKSGASFAGIGSRLNATGRVERISSRGDPNAVLSPDSIRGSVPSPGVKFLKDLRRLRNCGSGDGQKDRRERYLSNAFHGTGWFVIPIKE